MEESILKSTKKKLNVPPDDPSFDTDLIDHINSSFSHLLQLGVGPLAGYQIQNDAEKWTDFLPEAEDLPLRNQAKLCVYLRVRMLFDPPALSHVATALQNQLTEADTRLSIMREEKAWVNPNPVVVVVEDEL